MNARFVGTVWVVAIAAGCTGQIDDESSRDADPVVTPTPETTPAEPVVVANPPTPTLLQAQAENILNRSCGGCHGTDGIEAAGMNYIDDLDQLITNGKVVPGNADESPVIRRIRDGSMPPAGAPAVPPTADEIIQLTEFIDSLPPLSDAEGQPSLGLRRCEGQLVTYDEIFSLIQQDLLQFDGDDQEFQRYLGLTNRYNSSACTEDLEPERQAITKLLNSLSTEARIVVPEAIDDRNLIYRIDLRDLGWNRNVNVGGQNFDDGWEAIVGTSPYGIPFEGGAADGVRLLSNTDIPFIFSNAVVAAASSGDLYYELLEIPNDLNALLDDQRIDVVDDIERGRARRAGTTQSGISSQNRVVQRHDGATGAFWQSFDFGANDRDGEMFSDPLGFNPGETEISFTLRNGLMAFASFDENGNRLEESNILFDTLAENQFEVRAGVSCMTCHSRGYLQVRDEVREFVTEIARFDIDADTRQLVEELYPTQEDMDAIIEEDRAVFLAALAETGIPQDIADPISNSFNRFAFTLSFDDVAGELGVTPDLLERQLPRLGRDFATLNTGSISRERFDEQFLLGMCVLQGVNDVHPAEDLCFAVLD